MAKFVLLPAKALASAKTRLGKLLAAQDRQAVALAMYQDVLEAVAGAALPDGVLVVTSDPVLRAEAASHGFVVVAEELPPSLNRAVALGTRTCVGHGATTVATILTDIPLIRAADVDRLLATAGAKPGILMVPSKEGTGTNAMVMTPPEVIRSAFGRSSLQRHLARAEQKGVLGQLLEVETIGFDIDTPEDLVQLTRRNGSTRVQQLLTRILPPAAPVEPRSGHQEVEG